MIRRSSVTVSDDAGTPETGVYITVKSSAGTLLSLFNDNGTSLSNPFQSGALGAFVYNIADADAGTVYEEFRLSLSDDPRTINAIELGGSGGGANTTGLFVSPLDYGVVTGAGHGAANDAAMLAMFAALRTTAVNADAFYQGTIPIRFPAGYFEFSSTIDLTDGTFTLEGAGTGQSGGKGTLLKFPAGVTGIRVQRYNTSGASSTRTAAFGADGSIIRNLCLTGAYTATEGSAHGIHLRARAKITDVRIVNFEGDGIYAVDTGGSGGATEGNANGVFISACRIESCRNGLYIDGADTNIWCGIGIDCSGNRQWGINDSSFLGNSYFGCHADSNGLIPGSTPSVVSYSGNRYCVVVAQETGASTNAPSGTTADNTWWYYIGAGAVSTGNNIGAWTNGTTYRAGGSYTTDSSGNANNLFSGCYHEGGQGVAQIFAPSLVSGGSILPNLRGVAALYGGAGYVVSSAGLKANGNLITYGVQNDHGPTSGSAADFVTYLHNTNVSSQIFGQSTSGLIGSINFSYGTGNIYDVSNAGWEHRFRINGTTIARVNSGGIALKEIASASVPTPAAGEQALFIDTADHKLKRKDSSGTVTIIA